MPRAKTGDIWTYYETAGDGPPLVLITGLGLDSSSWAGQIAAFSSAHRVIAIDPRGSGRSDAPEPPYSIRDMADDTAGLLSALRVPRAHVMGLSMGGMIAIELALSHPSLVDSLILINTAARLPVRTQRVIESWLEMVGVDRRAFVRAQLPWVFAERMIALNEDTEALVQAFASMARPPLSGFAGQVGALVAYDARGRLGEIRVPTMIMAGREDILVPTAASDELAHRIPGARLLLFDGGAHAVVLECVDQLNAAVLRFLGDVERPAA